MAIRQSIRQPIRQSIRQRITGPPFQRFFTTLASASSQHFNIPTVTLTGDFEITFLQQSTFAGSFKTVLGNSGDISMRVTVDAVDEVTVKIADVNVSTSGANLADGKIHSIIVKRTSGTTTITVDGVALGSGAQASSFVINQIGVAASINRYDGVIANLSIKDAGTLIRSYAINEDLSTTSTIVDSISGQDGTAVNITASELFTQQANGDFLSNTELWTFGDSVSNGAEGAFMDINSGAAPLTVGDRYLAIYDVTNQTSGAMQFRFGGTTGQTITANGSFTEARIATIAGGLKTRVGATQCNLGATISNISVKRFLEKA